MNTIPSRYQGRLALAYIVAPGDTLESIAVRYLGSADVLTLWETNKGHLRGASPNVIFPGEVVLIPFARFSRALVL